MKTPGVRYAPESSGPFGDSLYILLWPNVTLNFFSGEENLVIYWFRPISPTQTIGIFEYYFAEGTDAAFQDTLADFWDRVGMEDVALVESVQRGVTSGIVPRGRLVMGRESLVHAFQLLTLDQLQAKENPARVTAEAAE